MGYFQSFEGVAFQIELLFFVDAPRARVKINTQEQTDTNRILREFMWRLHEDPGLPPGNPPPNFIPLSLENLPDLWVVLRLESAIAGRT